jgi:hypothetical protein
MGVFGIRLYLPFGFAYPCVFCPLGGLWVLMPNYGIQNFIFNRTHVASIIRVKGGRQHSTKQHEKTKRMDGTQQQHMVAARALAPMT